MNKSNLLFLPDVDPHAFFEKEASIAKVPDDEKKWPSHILSELYKQLPFLSSYDVDISMQRIEPEAGFAFGYALVLNKNDPAAATDSKNVENHLRIPLIVADRHLQPFHTFEVGGDIYPVTAERVEAAMLNPAIFDGPAEVPKTQKSLVDQLHPPYQQRQGFGGGVGGSAGLGHSKMSSAPGTEKEAVAKRLYRLSAVIAATKTAQKEASVKSRLLGAAALTTAAATSAGAGHAVGKKKGKKSGLRTGYVIGGRKGYLTGLEEGKKSHKHASGLDPSEEKRLSPAQRALLGAGLGYRGSKKEAEVPVKALEDTDKEAMVPLNFDSGRRIPSSMVMQGVKIPLAPGIVPMDLHFFPVPGTKFVVGVHKTLAKKLGKIRDQQQLRQALAHPMRSEIRAARSNRRSPGLFLLLSKEKKGYRYHKPKATQGLA